MRVIPVWQPGMLDAGAIAMGFQSIPKPQDHFLDVSGALSRYPLSHLHIRLGQPSHNMSIQLVVAPQPQFLSCISIDADMLIRSHIRLVRAVTRASTSITQHVDNRIKRSCNLSNSQCSAPTTRCQTMTVPHTNMCALVLRCVADL